MIVPCTRLLIWFAIIVVPFATLAGVVSEAAPFAFFAIAAFALAAIVDAFLTAGILRGISIELPPLLRASQERPFSIVTRLRNPSQKARTLRLALAFPLELLPSVDEFTVALPADSEWSAFDWSCSAVQRGRFQIVFARIEAASPMGFWSRWKTIPVQSEVRVYPNLARDRNNLAALFLNRGAFGIHAQRQIGRGRDFEKLREYIPGDSFEDVHWKATAKRGHPVTKVFQIERTQEVYVIIDASRLSGRKVEGNKLRVEGPNASPLSPLNSQPVTTLERFITAALVLGLAAEQQGDHFGLLTFGDKIETFIRARSGKAHYHACRDALYTLQPREVAPDFDELSTFIRLRLRRRALLLFLTSLDDPVAAESFVRNMDLLRRQHFVLVNMLQPPGVRPLFSNAGINSAAEMYSELAGHMRWHGLRELEKVLQRRGVRLSLLQSERLAVDLVSQYVNVKQRQLL
ncbi:MAG TPA: DUF58 domain-containing protein [Candidatus Limnocylindria bacterium]|nr:DUF58 domain-containing protein [Candidatus Limnocylindria bacterium]